MWMDAFVLKSVKLYSLSSVPTGNWFRDSPWISKSMDAQVPYIKWHSIYMTYICPPVHVKSSLDYLQFLIQCKCCVNCCQCAANSSFAFWNSLKFIFLNIFDPWLAEIVDAEPMNTESQLHIHTHATNVSITLYYLWTLYVCYIKMHKK